MQICVSSHHSDTTGNPEETMAFKLYATVKSLPRLCLHSFVVSTLFCLAIPVRCMRLYLCAVFRCVEFLLDTVCGYPQFSLDTLSRFMTFCRRPARCTYLCRCTCFLWFQYYLDIFYAPRAARSKTNASWIVSLAVQICYDLCSMGLGWIYSSIPRQSFRFLNLPAEIRNKIYRVALRDISFELTTNAGSKERVEPGNKRHQIIPLGLDRNLVVHHDGRHGLLTVNKQIRREARQIFFQHAIFIADARIPKAGPDDGDSPKRTASNRLIECMPTTWRSSVTQMEFAAGWLDNISLLPNLRMVKWHTCCFLEGRPKPGYDGISLFELLSGSDEVLVWNVVRDYEPIDTTIDDLGPHKCVKCLNIVRKRPDIVWEGLSTPSPD